MKPSHVHAFHLPKCLAVFFTLLWYPAGVQQSLQEIIFIKKIHQFLHHVLPSAAGVTRIGPTLTPAHARPYCSLGSVSTLTKRIIFIFLEKWICFLVLKLYVFPSSSIILWYE
jgi:hypothetical protein